MNWKEETKEQIKALTVSGIIIVAVWFMFQSWSEVSKFFGNIFEALKPFLLGFCLCFILVPLRHIIEDKWLANTKMKQRNKRKLAVTLSLLIFILILVLFFAILIPQLSASAMQLGNNMDGYVKGFNELISKFSQDNNPRYQEFFNDAYYEIQKFLTGWLTGQNGFLNRLVSFSIGFVKGIFNFFVGMIIAIYLLLDQEKFKMQIRRFNYAFFTPKHAENMTRLGELSSKMFNNFIFGKALDSLIVGIVCYVSCLLMRMPYAPLIGFVIGITNMIPVFGPFLGAIPCIFILLIINPTKSLEFAIFILALQQVDGNILGPYILGDSMGLPALWVLFAIITGGAMFGVLGMFLGVPFFSVIYYLVNEKINNRLGESGTNIPDNE